MRSEKYSVDFSYLDQKKAQTYATQPQTEAEFLSWKQGDEATLQKNNLGQVTSFVRGHNPTGSAKPQSNRH